MADCPTRSLFLEMLPSSNSIRRSHLSPVSLISSLIYYFRFEMGSWDPTLYGFTPLQYLGTNMTNGSTDSTSACVTGLDNIGFVYGTSSTLFNQIVLQFNSTVSLPSILENLIQDALNDFGESNNDISDINNPFYQYHNGNNPWADTRELTLVDGGEDGENIPLHPLIQPYREVDTIFAVDSSADTDTYWVSSSLCFGQPGCVQC